MMKQTLLLFLLLCTCLRGLAQSRPVKPYMPFRVYDMHSGDQIKLTELTELLGNTDVLFFGEEHNDTIGHILELKVLKLLAEKYRSRLALSLEMFETDCQVVLDDYLGGFISEEQLIKQGRAWNNYTGDYKPMVEFAKTERLPVIAANAPRRYVNLVTRRGVRSLDSLSNGAKQYLAKLPIYVPKGRYFRKFTDLMGGMDNMHSPHMFASQSLWDATMATSILEAHRALKKGGLVFHVCGRFHSDEYLGTVRQLSRKDKKLVISTISCFPAADYDNPDLSRYEGLADFVILTEQKNKTEQ